MSHENALRAFVVREVSRVLNGPTSDWKYDLCRRFNLLPISADASGALFLRADGEVLNIGWGSSEVPRVVEDVRPFLPTFKHFVRNHPEIGTLLDRPEYGILCKPCGGKGCGECSGLGWVTNCALTFRSKTDRPQAAGR